MTCLHTYLGMHTLFIVGVCLWPAFLFLSCHRDTPNFQNKVFLLQLRLGGHVATYLPYLAFNKLHTHVHPAQPAHTPAYIHPTHPANKHTHTYLGVNSTMPVANLLAGKTAIITGGTTGIGRAITLAFIAQGCSVAVNHLDLEKDRPHVESLVAEAEALLQQQQQQQSNVTASAVGRLVLQTGDIREPSTAARLVALCVASFGTGRLDVCVSNAGICTFAEFLDLDHALYDSTVRTNLDGAFYVVQAAARQMARGQTPPGGSIIGMSSISALVGGGGQTHYTPTKAGVTSLMQSTAVALGRYSIRCNALLPGTIRTQLNEEDLRDDAKRQYMERRIPLGRTGDPKDLGGPAVFLACEELSGYVTGAQLLVDGGLFVNLQ